MSLSLNSKKILKGVLLILIILDYPHVEQIRLQLPCNI